MKKDTGRFLGRTERPVFRLFSRFLVTVVSRRIEHFTRLDLEFVLTPVGLDDENGWCFWVLRR